MTTMAPFTQSFLRLSLFFLICRLKCTTLHMPSFQHHLYCKSAPLPHTPASLIPFRLHTPFLLSKHLYHHHARFYTFSPPLHFYHLFISPFPQQKRISTHPDPHFPPLSHHHTHSPLLHKVSLTSPFQPTFTMSLLRCTSLCMPFSRHYLFPTYQPTCSSLSHILLPTPIIHPLKTSTLTHSFIPQVLMHHSKYTICIDQLHVINFN